MTKPTLTPRPGSASTRTTKDPVPALRSQPEPSKTEVEPSKREGASPFQFTKDSLLCLYQQLGRADAGPITLNGESLDLGQVAAVARNEALVEFSQDPRFRNRIASCYERMMGDIREGVPAYGCNTAFGQQASLHWNHGETEVSRIETARKVFESMAKLSSSNSFCPVKVLRRRGATTFSAWVLNQRIPTPW